jgi:hypothetical protein
MITQESIESGYTEFLSTQCGDINFKMMLKERGEHLIWENEVRIEYFHIPTKIIGYIDISKTYYDVMSKDMDKFLNILHTNITIGIINQTSPVLSAPQITIPIVKHHDVITEPNRPKIYKNNNYRR